MCVCVCVCVCVNNRHLNNKTYPSLQSLCFTSILATALQALFWVICLLAPLCQSMHQAVNKTLNDGSVSCLTNCVKNRTCQGRKQVAFVNLCLLLPLKSSQEYMHGKGTKNGDKLVLNIDSEEFSQLSFSDPFNA